MFLKTRNISNLTDEALVEHYVVNKNNSYLTELFNRYTTLVFGVCVKYLRDSEEAKDATMQIFEKLVTDLEKHQIKTFRPWLHTVAKNHCLMRLRKETGVSFSSVEHKVNEDGFMEFDAEEHLHDNKFEQEVKLEQLESAVNNLNVEQRRCIELFYFKQKCYDEIATITGFTAKQVKSYIQNGRRNLKISLEKQNG